VKRNASAVWNGNLKDGSGTMSSESGALRDAKYSFGTRFESAAGTNPEELIAAAHAGCFSMALSGVLTGGGNPPERVATTAAVTLEKRDVGFTVTNVHLDVTAKVPGIDAAAFTAAANKAKETCPISRLLNAEITMEARLEG
jgi:osmotically inducible protein OsmC